MMFDEWARENFAKLSQSDISISRIAFLAGQASAIPDGYVLVPVEPNGKMKRAAQVAQMDHSPHKEWLRYDWHDVNTVYKAMIAAAQREMK